MDAQEWGEEIPRGEVIDPVVFHFRPTKWVAIDEAHRCDFERFFFENVGFTIPSAGSAVQPHLRPVWPNGGISGSNDGWDD
jgi:hypothetical protein